MKILDWTISAGALLMSVYTFFKHDKKLKDQEKRLNAIAIQKYEEEEMLKRRADVKANIFKEGEKGKRILRIYNRGQANARNIRLNILSETDGLILFRFDEKLPYELLTPYDKFDLILFCTGEFVPTLKIQLIWDDDYNDRFSEQVLSV